MYSRTEMEEYQDAWIKAERDLALNNSQISGWDIESQKESPDSEVINPQIPEPPTEEGMG